MKLFHELIAMNIGLDDKCFAVTLSYSNFSYVDLKRSSNDLSLDYEIKKEVQNEHNMKIIISVIVLL